MKTGLNSRLISPMSTFIGVLTVLKERLLTNSTMPMKDGGNGKKVIGRTAAVTPSS